jgi:hypothetical protein
MAYKLMRLRRNGTIGSLFINRKAITPIGDWLESKDFKTPGYAHRPGWHVTLTPCAPHLSMKGRVWMRVEVEDFVELKRPASQGGVWLLAQKMKVVGFL